MSFFDRNKTPLTREITAASCQWLSERGCKPIATEVEITCGWVADIATAVFPTETELQDLKLVKRKPAWEKPVERKMWHEVAGPLMRLMTVIVEVKTTRADFNKDRKWKEALPADLNFLAMPLGLVGDSDWPPGWGVLAFDSTSERFKLLRVPAVRASSFEHQRNFVYAMACRRHNQEEYGEIRKLIRRDQSSANEYTNSYRFSKVMRAALAIARGERESVEQALEYHGVKGISGDVLEQAKRLWSIARKD